MPIHTREERIPTDDTDAFNFYPAHRWTYDRFRLARSQGFNCGPHVSTDCAVVDGEMAWCRHTLGIPGVAGTFDYWIVEERARPRLELYCCQWMRANLRGYTGMVNIETIGGRIIETHPRFSDQWADLYGRKWFEAVARLYRGGTWDLINAGQAVGYSVVLFAPHGRRYVYPAADTIAAHEQGVGISSIQLTFSRDRPPEAQMPPEDFRLAVINCFNLDVGLRVRAALARDFGLQGAAHRRRTLAASRSASELNASL